MTTGPPSDSDVETAVTSDGTSPSSRGQESATSFDILAAALDVVVFICEPTGRILWTNQKFRDHTGFTVDDFQFENPDNPFVHPDDLEVVGKAFTEFFESSARVSQPVENRFYDRWGGVQHYRSRLAKISWNGQPACLVVTTPITAAVADAYAVSEARYRRLVDTAGDGIVTLAEDGTIRFANRHFLTMTKLDAMHAAKRVFWDLLHSEERRAVRELFTSKGRGSAPSRFEARLVASDGQELNVDVNASRFEHGNEEGGFLAIVRDVTENRRLAERMRQTQKVEELGVFAGGIAHDFNNLIGAILGNATLARRSLTAGKPIDSMLADIETAAKRAGALSTSMLQYVGKTATRIEWTDVVPLVDEMRLLLETVVPKHVRLDITTDGGPLPVLADANQLRQVVMNLIVNAADATREPGVVRVEAFPLSDADGRGEWLPDTPPQGPVVVVRVIDRGCGMTPEQRQSMFDPFFTTKAKGHGLGLSAVLGILKSHGGAIRIDSSPGEGTTAEFALRRVARERQEPQPAVQAPIETRGASQPCEILFVDDDDLVRRLGEAILSSAGFVVTTAVDGEDAIARLSEAPSRFCLVVLDFTMPGMGGKRTAERIHDLRSDLPILLISGFGDDVRVEGVEFLSKPFGAKELLDAVARVRSAAHRLKV